MLEMHNWVVLTFAVRNMFVRAPMRYFMAQFLTDILIKKEKSFLLFNLGVYLKDF